jgi:hypothetical protein
VVVGWLVGGLVGGLGRMRVVDGYWMVCLWVGWLVRLGVQVWLIVIGWIA